MNIIADRHQSDLTWSLKLLADRLGAMLYTPYGIEWYDQGYFKLYGDLNKKDPYRWLAKQYLVDAFYKYDGDTAIGLETLNGCVDYPVFKTLTLDQAKQTPIDVIICSVNENEKYFSRLKEFHPNAKFVRHVGNQLDTNIDSTLYPNLLASATAPYDLFTGHKVLYRQEFDLNLFKSLPLRNYHNFWSFQNDLDQFEDVWKMWVDLRHLMPTYNFKSYGVANSEGKLYSKREYIAKMLESTFVYQVKFSEGYGHVIHNAFCLGRIPVINKETYLQGIAAPLLEDEVTCLYVEPTAEETARKVEYWSEPSRANKLSQGASNRFKQVVNFDTDFMAVKNFFDNLV